MTTVLVEIDGTDVTQYAVSGSSTRRLNRPSQAQVKLPMQNSIGGAGSILKVTINGSLHHHGHVLLCETDTGEDTGYTVYNSTDPMELWQFRPVRDADGDFTNPRVIEANIYGPEIMAAVLDNSIAAGAGPPSDAEGPLFLDVGTVEAGCSDLSGAPVDWPMTIAELASLLVSTGELDMVITPTDPGGDILGTIDFFCGDYGSNLASSVAFQYGMGAFNVSRLRWNEDMSNMANKIWYYAGPRIQTAADPGGDQHWCFNVQGQDPVFFTGGDMFPPGGRSVDASNNPVGPPWTNNPIGEMIYNSRQTYGVRMDIQIFDAADETCIPGFGTVGRKLYQRRWQEESWIRAQPRELIHITPTRETEIGTFDIGDLVLVEATTDVRGGFSGVQRIYEYTIGWDDNGVVFLDELQTSPTADGF